MDLLAVAGVPESALDERSAAALPADAPAAPWTCRCDAIVWAALPHRPEELPAGLIRLPTVVCGALLSYSASPVGPYREVLGLLAGSSLRRVSVPFIAVDSPASLVGGRLNWALPKTLAEFTGEPGTGAMTATGTMTATGDGWTVSATARPLGPAVPFRLTGRLVQPWPDGRRRAARLTGWASARPALVRVAVRSSGSLAGWLRPGRHLGLLLRRAEFSLAAPTSR
jgi:hypothetical protein